MKSRVAVIGDLVIDHFYYHDLAIEKGGNYLLEGMKSQPGGVAGNIAFYLKQFGVEPVVFSAVGKDEEGKYLLSDLEKSGIKTEHIRIAEGKSGFLIVIVGSDGERTMLGSRGVANFYMPDSEEIISSSPSWIHVSGYMLLGRRGKEIWREAVRAKRELGVNLSLGLEGMQNVKIDVEEDASIIFCNRMEFQMYFGSDYEAVAKKFKPTIIVKSGPEGCYLLKDEVTRVEGVKTKIVKDTTGAGDLFDAAVITSLLAGREIIDSCRTANYLASVKVSKKGTRMNFGMSLLRKLFSSR
ncbi:MAG: carbohydrate kinase family protein [Conexivisphaerales archaeon]